MSEENEGGATVTCRFSEDRKLVVCGGGNRRQYHYFTKKCGAVLFCDSLWYEPHLVEKLRRNGSERIDLFRARVKKKLGFMPLTFRGWWRTVALPQIKQMKADNKKRRNAHA